MKKSSLLYLFAIITFAACKNETGSKPIAIAQFVKDTFDFQTIRKGDSASIVFTMQNTGTQNLLIKNTSVGCGCTTVSSLKDTVAPGKLMNLELIYDSKGDSGRVLKTVVVEANTDPRLHILYIKGIVE